MAEYSTIATLPNGDWDLNTFASGDEAIRMMLYSNLKAVTGTYEFDLDFGINIAYYSNNNDDINQIVNNVHKVILETAGITEAEILINNVTSNVTGILTIPFKYKTINDNQFNDIFITRV